MIKPQNLHSHSTYCDGTLTLEEMVCAAIEKGCGSFGFSGHSYAPYDVDCCMSKENTSRYIHEIRDLKEKYSDRIEIFLGIEQDYYAEKTQGGMDYVIGAVHYIGKPDELCCIDGGEERQKQACVKYYDGDYYKMAEAYFQTVSNVAKKTSADIVAHFDLITKYNIGGKLFDENHPLYVKAALTAMDEILKTCKLFEVNTGAMYKHGKPSPYPSEFLLKEINKRGGEVILTSDSHDAGSICHEFEKTQKMLKSCGFKNMKQLTVEGFVDVPL